MPWFAGGAAPVSGATTPARGGWASRCPGGGPEAGGFSDPPARPSARLPSVLAACHGFSLDVEEPTVFQEDGAGFGHSVAQFGRSRLVVGAPLEVVGANQTGRLYDCDAASGLFPLEAVNMSLGLSLAASVNRLLACGPTLHRACGENVHVEGSCLLLGPQLQVVRTVPAARPECPHQEMDIVFLIDGSGSIGQSDFKQMKNFVRAVMDQFKGTNTLFSLMQYSNILETHFNFIRFQTNPSPQRLLDPIVQLSGLTFTASAIQRGGELFHSKNGARKSAKKILIVITDGQKYKDPLEYSDVIPQAERAGIVRYAIGVGGAFQERAARQELDIIGSVPCRTMCSRWTTLPRSAASRSSCRRRSSQWREPSRGQVALSSMRCPKKASVQHSRRTDPFWALWGASAGLEVPSCTPKIRKPTFINMSQENVDMADSYLGYSTELALWKGVQSLVLGAPRHQHTGKAVIFTQAAGQWRPKAEVPGTQIGSYFGASLCSVDVDRDGSSTWSSSGLPITTSRPGGAGCLCAPCPGGARWQCQAVLRGEQGHPWGRFGAALTALGDVNGDKLTDVAIGAPGEQENRGAVYLFHGTSGLGVSPSHSQRIAGSQLSPRLQNFGQSLSGGQDLTQDGLADLAVGSRGHVLLLRSRPVLGVGVAIRFAPSEVGQAEYQCLEEVPSPLGAGSATICFTIHKSSPDQLGDVQSSVRYDLALDPGRLTPRAVFEETKNWTLTRRKILGLGEHCETLKLFLPDCVEDVVSPIILRVSFSLVGQPIPSSQNLRPVLAVGSQDLFTASLPFEKNCGQDHLCEGDLNVHLSFSGLQALVVGSSPELNVTVAVWNEGEDSYRTQPHQRPLHLACEAVPTGSESLRSSSCSINHPIFRGGSKGTFIVTFDVFYKATLGDKLLLRANVSSENNKPTTNKTTFQLELPVKYAVYTVISRKEESTKYFNFSTSDGKRGKKLSIDIVTNLSQRDLAISVHFWVPVLLNGVAVWDVAAVTPSQSLLWSEMEPPQQPDFQTQIPRSFVLDCSAAACRRFRCDVPAFSIQEELDFILKGNLSFGWVSQTQQKKVSVVSVAEITFDRAVYAQLPGQEAFLRAQMEMVLEEYEVYDPLPLVVGSSVGGLVLLALITATLFKLGFFKRRYKEMMDDKPEDAAMFSREAPTEPLS
ncbi:hypothetical protein QTO34_013201 [Cnephaeus nilssonii]|uniref:VWFA domain-containing protein n=1 Tax=Cnephaeus nilssonii TaxID=3371016 RepID=A0AA40LUX7_CNENI|nr:hypothetical protein QTO34_013201 [Eptesicus nilssonii]